MPRRPTWGLPSVAVALLGVASSLVEILASSAAASLPFGLFKADVGTRCCTIVELHANLYDGDAPLAGVDSEMTAFRMLDCEAENALVHLSLLAKTATTAPACGPVSRKGTVRRVYNYGIVPFRRLGMIVIFRASNCALASLVPNSQLP